MTHAYTFLVADKRYSVPNLLLVEAKDVDRARVIASQMLSESKQRMGIEVWEGDDLVFTLGDPYGRDTAARRWITEP